MSKNLVNELMLKIANNIDNSDIVVNILNHDGYISVMIYKCNNKYIVRDMECYNDEIELKFQKMCFIFRSLFENCEGVDIEILDS